MNVMNWSSPEEIKELMCGNKMIVIACKKMGCDVQVCGLWLTDPT